MIKTVIFQRLHCSQNFTGYHGACHAELELHLPFQLQEGMLLDHVTWKSPTFKVDEVIATLDGTDSYLFVGLPPMHLDTESAFKSWVNMYNGHGWKTEGYGRFE